MVGQWNSRETLKSKLEGNILYHSKMYGFTFYHFFDEASGEYHIHLDLPHFSKSVYKEIRKAQAWFEQHVKQDRGLSALYTAVKAENEMEVRWVERLGFKKIEERRDTGVLVYKYRKDL